MRNQSAKVTDNHMVMVACPLGGPSWANATKDRNYRCTKCGLTGHDRLKGYV